MIITKAKPQEVTAEEERRVAAALGLTIPSPAPQRPAVEAEPAALSFALSRPQPAPKGPRKPVYVNGVRLGRLALWT